MSHKTVKFHARCRFVERMTAEQMTPDQYAAQVAAGVASSWDRKLKAEVWRVQCDETFDDTAAFDRHMAEQHPKRGRIYESPNEEFRYLRNHKLPLPIPVQTWKGPRLTDAGKPLVTRPGLTQTCPSCELVAEVDDRAANVLWWDEHRRGCEIAKAAS